MAWYCICDVCNRTVKSGKESAHKLYHSSLSAVCFDNLNFVNKDHFNYFDLCSICYHKFMVEIQKFYLKLGLIKEEEVEE